MKIGVINFSGNTGKSTVATHLLKPRLPHAEVFAIETVNSGSDAEAIVYRGKQFDEVQQEVLLADSAIVDIGSSNVEEFLRLMGRSRGSHDDFDFFVVPTMKEVKMQADTFATINGLSSLGVPGRKIRIIYNAVELDDVGELNEIFSTIIDAGREGLCTCDPRWTIYQNDVFEKLKSDGRTVSEVVSDQTDYRALLRTTESRKDKEALVAKIAIQRLALSANENLDSVFATLLG
jgi:hypothetical protein